MSLTRLCRPALLQDSSMPYRAGVKEVSGKAVGLSLGGVSSMRGLHFARPLWE